MIYIGTGRRYLLVSIMAGIFFLVFGSADNAYATTFIISDKDSCENGAAVIPPGIGGDWTVMTSTCTLSTTLSIAGVDTLTVTKGVTLAFEPPVGNLVNQGEIINFGTIAITGGFLTGEAV